MEIFKSLILFWIYLVQAKYWYYFGYINWIFRYWTCFYRYLIWMCNHYLLVLFCIYVLAVSVVSREESSAILENYLLKNSTYCFIQDFWLFPRSISPLGIWLSEGSLVPIVIIMLKGFDIIF